MKKKYVKTVKVTKISDAQLVFLTYLGVKVILIGGAQ